MSTLNDEHFTTGATPAGHALRRAATVNEGGSTSRRNIARAPALSSVHEDHPSSADDISSSSLQQQQRRRRRSSLLSNGSLGESQKTLRATTGDILNPFGGAPSTSQAAPHHAHEEVSSVLRNLPLAFAVLPALAGVLFQNGSTIVADVLLLGVACIILRWTVTQPWQWYRAAQGVRLIKEIDLEEAVEDEDEEDDEDTGNRDVLEVAVGVEAAPDGDREPVLSDVEKPSGPRGEEAAKTGKKGVQSSQKPRNAHGSDHRKLQREEAALRELYIHEFLALFSCFIGPAVGAWLLHSIRSSLSRPSEGLVNDFNIGIFLLAAELHPLSHALKLVQARTLHLQKIVTADSLRHQLGHSLGSSDSSSVSAKGIQELYARLSELEDKMSPNYTHPVINTEVTNGTTQPPTQQPQDTNTTIRQLRTTLQSELDALNRAMRRYEKKATLLAFQTESRLGKLDGRLDDAIALAAAAAKNSRHGYGFWYGIGSLLSWTRDLTVGMVLLPFRAVVTVALLPVSWVRNMVTGRAVSGPSSRAGGVGSLGKRGYRGQSRSGSEREGLARGTRWQ